MSAGELLLEVRTEEIPARMLPAAAKELASRLFEELVARGLMPEEVEAGHTPRRLWVILKKIPLKEKSRPVIEVGPPASAAFDAEGRATAAALGFARKFGADPSSLKRRVFSKKDELETGTVLGGATKRPVKVKAEGDRVYLELTYEGRPTREILVELIPTLLGSLSWAKAMKWGSGIGPWVRPVHGVVALFDGAVVPFEFFDVEAGAGTSGHPTLSPQAFAVSGAEDWKRRLASLRIEPSPEVRQKSLGDEMARRAEAAGGRLVADPELLAKLAAICEIPGVLEGSFDPALLELPREVLATSLRDHQSALTVEKEGRLLPLFLTVMDRPDDPIGRVRAGNEWVVAARLADARFFWQKDRTQTLESRTAALAGLGFHQKLGTYADKRGRLISLGRAVAEWLGADEQTHERVGEAASLAKTDLTTEMVREFTSLQGVMGGIYAREEGLAEEVWTAIYDQYLPATTEDPLPRGTTGRILALADRIDVLVGFFAIGAVPTGSRDPFGLRRAALGALRIVLGMSPSGDLRRSPIDLGALVRRAHANFTLQLPKSAEETWALLRPFLEDRLRYLFELEGFAYDEIEAALRRDGETLADVGQLRERVRALHEARKRHEFLSVVLSAKRIANITRDQPPGELDPSAPGEPAEASLVGSAASLDEDLRQATDRGDFLAAIERVARISPSLESFFSEVMVIDPDERKRANRVALLRTIGGSIGRLADLSQLVVDKAEYR